MRRVELACIDAVAIGLLIRISRSRAFDWLVDHMTNTSQRESPTQRAAAL